MVRLGRLEDGARQGGDRGGDRGLRGDTLHSRWVVAYTTIVVVKCSKI